MSAAIPTQIMLSITMQRAAPSRLCHIGHAQYHSAARHTRRYATLRHAGDQCAACYTQHIMPMRHAQYHSAACHTQHVAPHTSCSVPACSMCQPACYVTYTTATSECSMLCQLVPKHTPCSTGCRVLHPACDNSMLQLHASISCDGRSGKQCCVRGHVITNKRQKDIVCMQQVNPAACTFC